MFNIIENNCGESCFVEVEEVDVRTEQRKSLLLSAYEAVKALFCKPKSESLSAGIQAQVIAQATDATKVAYESVRKSLRDRIPIARRNNPDEIRQLVRQLALVDDLVAAVSNETALRNMDR